MLRGLLLPFVVLYAIALYSPALGARILREHLGDIVVGCVANLTLWSILGDRMIRGDPQMRDKMMKGIYLSVDIILVACWHAITKSIYMSFPKENLSIETIAIIFTICIVKKMLVPTHSWPIVVYMGVLWCYLAGMGLFWIYEITSYEILPASYRYATMALGMVLFVVLLTHGKVRFSIFDLCVKAGIQTWEIQRCSIEYQQQWLSNVWTAYAVLSTRHGFMWAATFLPAFSTFRQVSTGKPGVGVLLLTVPVILFYQIPVDWIAICQLCIFLLGCGGYQITYKPLLPDDYWMERPWATAIIIYAFENRGRYPWSIHIIGYAIGVGGRDLERLYDRARQRREVNLDWFQIG